jgi:deoxyhypusine synthase
VSWGKVDPKSLPDCVVAYVDTTIALPLLTAYALNRHRPRKLKRLYDRRDEMYQNVKSIYLRIGTVSKIKTSRKLAKRAAGMAVKNGSS